MVINVSIFLDFDYMLSRLVFTLSQESYSLYKSVQVESYFFIGAELHHVEHLKVFHKSVEVASYFFAKLMEY